MSNLSLEYLGIIHPTVVHHNMSVAQLTERAVDRGCLLYTSRCV